MARTGKFPTLTVDGHCAVAADLGILSAEQRTAGSSKRPQ